MSSAFILVIEDDVSLNEQISELLVGNNYQVNSALDGEKGLHQAVANHYDLILLDIMLPGKDGLFVLNKLRKQSQTPVIFLTAKGAEQDRIQGLSLGADDYITKPFNSRELILRIEAILRRCKQKQDLTHPRAIQLDGLLLETHTQLVSVFGQPLELTRIQYRLLTVLIENRGDVLSKAFLYQAVLNKSLGAHDRSLDMHLSRVRRKLNQAGWNGERLTTVHGQGYGLI